MKSNNLLKSLCLVFMGLIFTYSTSALAQDQMPEKIFVDVGCIKAKSPDLLEFMVEKGTAFNKEAQAQGMLLDWILLEVIYPNGEDCECDYRSVTVFTDMEQLDMLTDPATGFSIANKVFGDQAQATWN